ncbi:MAG TPA: hypothetical protein VHL09_07250 [Dehalococcoidia bacterium]|nr:hypothetical protein [Dehalococcoidia bacterium]
MTKRSRRKKPAQSARARRRLPPFWVQWIFGLIVTGPAFLIYFLVDRATGQWTYAFGASAVLLIALMILLQPRLNRLYFEWADRRAAECAAQSAPPPASSPPPRAPTASPSRRRRK